MFGLYSRIDRLESQVRRQQLLIGELCRQVGIDPGVEVGVDAEELRLIHEGKKIVAIKHYRERTGAGLREAKDVIDAAAPRP